MSVSCDNQDWNGRRIDFGEFVAELAQQRWRIAVTEEAALRNGGKYRTASKKALLAQLARSGPAS